MATVRNPGIRCAVFSAFTICAFSLPVYAKYSGGTGEPNDPYQIATAEDLMLLGDTPEDYDKHFILTADIDLDPNLPGRKVFDRAVIASDESIDGTAFTGVFDGNGHSILHLMIEGDGYLGLFGRLESGGEVKNLGVVGVNVTGSGNYVGGLVGSSGYAGGMAGIRQSGTVTQCYSTGEVSGSDYVGGLVGLNLGGHVTQCYSAAVVGGSGYVGGLVGRNDGVIAQCYSTGNVGSGGAIGGLAGMGLVDRVTACFRDIQTSGQANSQGGTGKTTAPMQTASTFLEAGWDFVDETVNSTEDIWWILEGKDYPRLWWEANNN